MARFTPDELVLRSVHASRQQAVWSGSYPWRECSFCFAQIHVGGLTICDECQALDAEQETNECSTP